MAEARIDFACEISVITARGPDGAQVSYPAVENRHEAHILAQTIAPAPLPAVLAEEARALAERIARALGVVGLLAVEMFVTRDHRLLVNELAPRPHNSGHWTIDACAISQFELLVRAICGLPLPDPGRFADAVMDNLLGRGGRGLAHAARRARRAAPSLRQERGPPRAQARPRHPSDAAALSGDRGRGGRRAGSAPKSGFASGLE